MACDVELVEPEAVPLEVVLELALEGLDPDELVALDDVEDGAVEEFPLPEGVEPWLPARGSMYCWSPADGPPLASTVAGTDHATVMAAIRQMVSLRGIWSGEVLHPAREEGRV